jgi:hypothetical protein
LCKKEYAVEVLNGKESRCVLIEFNLRRRVFGNEDIS